MVPDLCRCTEDSEDGITDELHHDAIEAFDAERQNFGYPRLLSTRNPNQKLAIFSFVGAEEHLRHVVEVPTQKQ